MVKPGHILDMYDDAFGAHLVDGELMKKFGNVRIDPVQDLKSLADKDFALVVFTKTGEKVRKYPIHTPDSLAISLHYFEKTGSSMAPEARAIVATNLEIAHHRFGAEAPEEIRKLASEKVVGNAWNEGSWDGELVKEEVAPEARVSVKYAMRREMKDGSVVEMFPMDTLQDCIASSQELKKVGYELPAIERFKAASALLERMNEIQPSANSDPQLEKMASLEPNPAFMTHIAARMEVILDPESRKTLSNLSKLAGALPGIQLAEALEAFDLKSGLSYHWDKRIRNPFDSCFQAKTAGVKMGDRNVTAPEIVKLIDSGKLASMFKTSTLKDFRKQPLEVFESLPDPIKREIAGLI